MQGIFITFEGTEGAGKSTLIRAVAQVFEARGWQVTLTREPGGSPVAEQIRNLILEHPMDPRAELFLYEASRAEHMAKKIRPALEKGGVVLCDRFTDSSLAYQAHARGLPWKEVAELNRLATNGSEPDLTVFLDCDPAQGLRRAREKNRFELEGVKFQTRVRQGFLKARRRFPHRWLTLKAYSDAPEIMAQRILEEVEKRFKKRLRHG